MARCQLRLSILPIHPNKQKVHTCRTVLLHVRAPFLNVISGIQLTSLVYVKLSLTALLYALR